MTSEKDPNDLMDVLIPSEMDPEPDHTELVSSIAGIGLIPDPPAPDGQMRRAVAKSLGLEEKADLERKFAALAEKCGESCASELADLRREVERLRKRIHEVARAKDAEHAEHAERHRELEAMRAKMERARAYSEKLVADWTPDKGATWWGYTCETNRIALVGLLNTIAAERSAREKAEVERDHAIEMEARAVRRAEEAEEAREMAERERDEAAERLNEEAARAWKSYNDERGAYEETCRERDRIVASWKREELAWDEERDAARTDAAALQATVERLTEALCRCQALTLNRDDDVSREVHETCIAARRVLAPTVAGEPPKGEQP